MNETKMFCVPWGYPSLIMGVSGRKFKNIKNVSVSYDGLLMTRIAVNNKEAVFFLRCPPSGTRSIFIYERQK